MATDNDYSYDDDPLYRDEILKGLRDGLGAPDDGLGTMPPVDQNLPPGSGGEPWDPPVSDEPAPTGPINDFPDPIPGYTPGGPATGGQVFTETPGSAAYRAPTTTSASSGFSDAVRSRLLGLIAQDPNAVSIDDPSLAPASLAYRRAQERTVARQREAAAERANVQGLSGGSGALDAYTERAIQESGNAQASYDANLVLSELTRRKDMLENMLKTSAGILTADQDAQVRMAIANLQAEIDQKKIAQSAYDNEQERILRDAIAELQYGE